MSRWLANRWYGLTYWPTVALSMLLWGMRVTGRRHVPRNGPVILMANHQSMLDPPLIGAASPRRLTYLARRTLFRNPLFGSLIRLYGAVPIDQGGTGIDGLRATLDALSRGEAVLVFPEGHRTTDGELHELLAGIALLVKRARVSVVPVGIAGFYQAWPRGTKYPKTAPVMLRDTGRSLAVAFREALPPERFAGLKREAILAVLSEEMRNAASEAESIRRNEV